MALYCSNCGGQLPDDARYCSACGRPVAGAQGCQGSRPSMVRPRAGRKIAGVCQGIAIHLGWDATALRVVAVLLAIFLFPLGIVAYLILWLVMPEEPRPLPPGMPVEP